MRNDEWKKEEGVREEDAEAGVGGQGLGIGDVSPATNHQPLTPNHPPPTTIKTEQPDLPMDVPVSLPKPGTAWSGGEHDGSRLKPEQRAEIYQRHMDGQSTLKISKEMKVSRNTIDALVKPDDPQVAEHLQSTRKARLLAKEDELMRIRDEVMEEKAKMGMGKLSIGDLNSALMINGIGIKESGGAAPQRIRVEADPSLIMAAQIFSGQFKPALALPEPAVRVPAPVMEAEVVGEDAETGRLGVEEKIQTAKS